MSTGKGKAGEPARPGRNRQGRGVRGDTKTLLGLGAQVTLSFSALSTANKTFWSPRATWGACRHPQTWTEAAVTGRGCNTKTPLLRGRASSWRGSLGRKEGRGLRAFPHKREKLLLQYRGEFWGVQAPEGSALWQEQAAIPCPLPQADPASKTSCSCPACVTGWD